MLKRVASEPSLRRFAAAFRRLCVETSPDMKMPPWLPPAAFRRLCVETIMLSMLLAGAIQPPSGGCVLKQPCNARGESGVSAAFRRLCVETI